MEIVVNVTSLYQSGCFPVGSGETPCYIYQSLERGGLEYEVQYPTAW